MSKDTVHLVFVYCTSLFVDKFLIGWMTPSLQLLKARTVLKLTGGFSPASTRYSTVVFSPQEKYFAKKFIILYNTVHSPFGNIKSGRSAY